MCYGYVYVQVYFWKKKGSQLLEYSKISQSYTRKQSNKFKESTSIILKNNPVKLNLYKILFYEYNNCNIIHTFIKLTTIIQFLIIY